MRSAAVLVTSTFALVIFACKNDAQVGPPRMAAAPPAPATPIVVGTVAATKHSDRSEPATETCHSDDDCISSTFPGCCSCCECGPSHASTRTMDAAQRDACRIKDCRSCDNLDYKCVPCQEHDKDDTPSRCLNGTCTLVAKSPPATPLPVPCKTTDDCWFGESYEPIARPKKLRGKKITPCKDGEHAPACSDGVCIVRAYKC